MTLIRTLHIHSFTNPFPSTNLCSPPTSHAHSALRAPARSSRPARTDSACAPRRRRPRPRRLPSRDGLRSPTLPPARGTDSSCATRRHCPRPPSRLVPPIAARLHPPAATTAKVHTTDELRTGDLRALHGIELRAGVELHKDEVCSSKHQGDIVLKAHVASVYFECFGCFKGML
jgi:hypothetical protein